MVNCLNEVMESRPPEQGLLKRMNILGKCPFRITAGGIFLGGCR